MYEYIGSGMVYDTEGHKIVICGTRHHHKSDLFYDLDVDGYVKYANFGVTRWDGRHKIDLPTGDILYIKSRREYNCFDDQPVVYTKIWGSGKEDVNQVWVPFTSVKFGLLDSTVGVYLRDKKVKCLGFMVDFAILLLDEKCQLIGVGFLDNMSWEKRIRIGDVVWCTGEWAKRVMLAT